MEDGSFELGNLGEGGENIVKMVMEFLYVVGLVVIGVLMGGFVMTIFQEVMESPVIGLIGLLLFIFGGFYFILVVLQMLSGWGTPGARRIGERELMNIPALGVYLRRNVCCECRETQTEPVTLFGTGNPPILNQSPSQDPNTQNQSGSSSDEGEFESPPSQSQQFPRRRRSPPPGMYTRFGFGLELQPGTRGLFNTEFQKALLKSPRIRNSFDHDDNNLAIPSSLFLFGRGRNKEGQGQEDGGGDY